MTTLYYNSPDTDLPPRPDIKRTVFIWLVPAVLALAAANAFWQLGTLTLDSHECFVAVAAREMHQSGNWLLPTMNGRPRINKGPLAYWLVALTDQATGRIDEFTARFPSAVFAVLATLFVPTITCRLSARTRLSFISVLRPSVTPGTKKAIAGSPFSFI